MSRQVKSKIKKQKVPYLGLANKLRALNAKNIDINAKTIDKTNEFKGGWNSGDDEKQKSILVAFEKPQKDDDPKVTKKTDEINEN